MLLRVTAFAGDHIEQALALLRARYADERKHAPDLPPIEELTLPSLEPFTQNGLGIAALQNGALQGYIGFPNPFPGMFGAVSGTFSPLHAHATSNTNAGYIYSRLYEAAAEILVGRGALSHAVVLFAHDAPAIDAFFTNGFGMRTVDAIRTTAPIASRETPGISYRELPLSELEAILPLHHGLAGHLARSPMFMAFGKVSLQELRTMQARRDSRFFVAQAERASVGYIEVTAEGESFATVHPRMRNICGAYLQPAYRERGIYSALLACTIDTLRAEGIHYLGVDHEGFNPTATAFWRKHFTPYTRGLTRRIDERIIGARTFNK